VWIPRDAAEVEEATERGDLEETHIFDAKAALPPPKKNHDLAVDVAAMAVDGGVLLYGLGEDDNKRLTVLSPMVLEGVRERIAQIVQTSISEPPFVRIQALGKADDPSKGYVVVIVPQSERAPHQVISGADMRFYGRGATGNRILSEGEVAELYARRKSWEADRDQLLDEEIASSPEPDASLGYLHAYARPVAPDDGMLERATSDENPLKELLLAGARSWGDVKPDPRSGRRGYDPDLRRAETFWRRGVEGWALSTERKDEEEPKYTARVYVDHNGMGHFFVAESRTRLVKGASSSSR
jgi:hypothetical protein